jgi:hypothetical protein
MALIIEGGLEQRLDSAAKSRGVSALALAADLIERGLAVQPDPLLQWLEDTEKQWATADPDELAKRQSEGEAFMRELAASRELTHGPDARKL